MAQDVRKYRNKIWFSGEAKDELLYLANEMGVEPEEVVRQAIQGYRLWVNEQSKSKGRKQQRPS